MVKVVVDTSILIEEVRQGSPGLRKLAKMARDGRWKLIIPVTVIGELWAGQSMRFKLSRQAMLNKLKGMEIMDIDVNTACKYGEIVRHGGRQGNDTWIAASALVNRAKVATLNKKDFEKIEGLKLVL